jgi:hypothetical protein
LYRAIGYRTFVRWADVSPRMRECIKKSVSRYMHELAPAFAERGVSIVKYQYGRGAPSYVAVATDKLEDDARPGLVLVKLGRDTKWVPMELLWGKRMVSTE